MNTPIIMPADVEIETQTVTQYRAKGKHFWCSTECDARYDGCTHEVCHNCGKPAPKPYIKCNGCTSLAESEAHAKLKHCKWDGASMVYSHRTDKWYASPEDVYDDIDDGETWESYRVVLGEKLPPPTFDIDRWEEQQDEYQIEDGDPLIDTRDPEIMAIVAQFDAIVAANYSPVYRASNVAVSEPANQPGTVQGTTC